MPDESKKSANQTQKAEAKKPEKMSGSLNKDYKFDAGEKNLVHLMLEDFASPRNRDMNEAYKPQQRVVKLSPDMFVRTFGAQYLENDAFKGVTTPELVVRIAKNLTKKEVESAYEDRIFESTQGKPKLKAQLVENILKDKKKLKMSGGNQICKEVLHIPADMDQYPFDPKKLDKFPEECLH